jgi:UDP-galactopyranose mutase
MVHKYGPHVFHTKQVAVWNFLQDYTEFDRLDLKIVAELQDRRVVPIPYNDTTRRIVGDWTEEDILREIVVPYSEKMWGCPFAEIPKSITNRVPKPRVGNDDRWHQDTLQGVPRHGYTQMVESMLEGCDVLVGVDGDYWRRIRDDFDLVVYTGKLDDYFQSIHGALPYRSLNIVSEVKTWRLPTMQMNACNTRNPFTRQIDHGHWYPYRSSVSKWTTIISTETPCAHVPGENEAFYPMAAFAGVEELAGKYRAMAEAESRTLFVGRLATYTYLDMDVAVGIALKTAERLLNLPI